MRSRFSGAKAVCSFAAVLLLSGGCGGPGAQTPAAARRPTGPVPYVIVERDGDPATALSATVLTAGITPDARASVALSALLESRLASKWPGASFIPSADGFRIERVIDDHDAAAAGAALRAALLAPATASELPLIKKKLDALAHRPLPIPASSSPDAIGAVAEVARCEATPFSASTSEQNISAALVEAWRRAAVGEGRLAFAIVGNGATAMAAANALNAAPWPKAAALVESAPQTSDDGAAIVDASPGIPAGTARVTIAFRTARATPAVEAATDLANPESALASRLAALGGARSVAQITDVTATAHPFGGCLSLTLDVTGARFSDDPITAAGRVAEVVALARQEVTLLLTAASAHSSVRATAHSGDARDAAALASWWALVRDDAPANDRIAVVVRTPPSREAAASARAPTAASPASDALKNALNAAETAWKSPVVESRVRVEHGQDELWVLVASPCGTSAERSTDAGLSATFLVAAASAGSTRVGRDVVLEPWFSADGVGLVAHGAARAGETPIAHAQRIADAAARYFAAEPIDSATLSVARGSLLERAESSDAKEMAVLANAVFPDHPSWLDPRGTADALARSSNGAVLARADDLRRGPLRVAVLANKNTEQASAAVEAADRWIARKFSGIRMCGASPAPAIARVGTYAFDAAGRPAEAELALRLPHDDAQSRALAAWWVSILEGTDGLLATALGSTGLARSWDARLVGPDRDSALVVRIVSSDAALDPAVAQTRALFDRIRGGALTADEVARAAERKSHDELSSSLDPRARLVATWRGASTKNAVPTLDALRTFASSFFHDDAWVILAARPARLDEASHEKTN
ncbi:MAG: hypothetical protein ABI183_06710 [Polyangiaceae bacterium]